ncbi:MFS transporter [Actinospongicola halichondriae]|uniref:MFS transporter n=1 Tax=Actinospongicola halichondriae TaxID=3236844 RepID=UPI003D3AA145
MSARQRLDDITGGAPVGPLVVLFGLNFVDELDRIAFGVLAPEIGTTFDLADSSVILISSLVAVFTLVAALPLAALGDRMNRVRLVAFAAMAWSTMAVLTGLSGVVKILAVLVVARFLAGIGRVINEPVHSSLIADYYEPEHQPKVFAVHRFANPASSASAVAIGALALVIPWQTVFIVIAVPTAVLILSLLRLREPLRGESIDAELAALEVDASPIGFAEARRQLFGIRSLKRLYLGSLFLGFGLIPLGGFISFFFERVYGFSTFERGFTSFVFGAGSTVGLVVGARLAGRAEPGSGELAKITGYSFVTGGVALLLMALAPFAAISVALLFASGIGFGAYIPAYFPLVSVIAPPRVRTQAYGYSLIAIGVGGLLGAVIAGGLGDDNGYRVAVGVTASVVAASGLFAWSAAPFVARDREQAERTLRAARDQQAAVAAGRGALLSCTGVEVAYDQVQVLFGVDLQIQPGEIVALLGTNGAGKSTLLKAISGAVDPIGGSILFDGSDITHTDAVATVTAGIVQVPGGKAVFPTLTVAEHLRAGGWLYRSDEDYLAEAIAEVYEIFPRLLERKDQLAGNLSGGEQQMLALGMAFIAKPKLLMIDELSLGLAPTIVEQLLGIVRRIQGDGTAIILVEQSINVALSIAERAYFLEKGEVRFEGPTSELIERDDIVRSVFLEGASASGERSASTTASPVDPDRLPIGEPVLELRGVVKSFGGVQAVTGASFELRAHEILGLIGPNGAGKTTIFDLISGFLTPDEGRIVLAGDDVTGLGPDRRAWRGLGRSFQDARLVPSLTVAENLAIGLERFIELRDPVASALGLPAIVRQEEDVAWTVGDLIELMNLGAFRDKFVRELSTGSRRIVDLAMCIAHDPDVLLLDEPSSGIAQKETEALGPLLRTIQHETGCALLIIEHDMPLITGISDRMIALELGAPIAEGTPAEVTSDPRVVSSYLGGDMATINRSNGTARRTPLVAT